MPPRCHPSRRAVLRAAGAAGLALAAPTLVRAAETGRRRFAILRDGDEIGSHTVALSRSGDEIQAAIDIEIQVKVLGITAYRYEMTSRETWRAGRLVSLDSDVNDDGDPDHARARAAGGMIEIDGSDYTGTVAADSAPTSYWSHDFLKRPVWINTQTGVPITVTAAAAGVSEVQGANGTVATETWTAKGDNLDVLLHYAGRDWVSIEFDAQGERAKYRPDSTGPVFMPVWDAAA